MEKNEYPYDLLVCQEFFLLKPNKQKKSSSERNSYLKSVKPGEILHFSNPTDKLKWKIKVFKIVNTESGVEKFTGIIPSTILVPIIRNDTISDYLSISSEEKMKVMPEITKKERKYFPLIHTYYDQMIGLLPCRNSSASWISLLFYNWLTYYINIGFKRPLVKGDFWVSSKKESLNYYHDKYESILESLRKEDLHKNKKGSGNVSNNLHLLKAFFILFKVGLFQAFICKFLQDIIKFSTPFLIAQFIKVSTDPERLKIWGPILSILLFVENILNSLLLNKFYELISLIGGNFRAILISKTYKKMMKLKPQYISRYPLSFQLNLITGDCFKIQEAVINANFIWSSPLQIVLCLIYLWFILGVSSLPGLGVLILILPSNYILATIIKKIQARQNAIKDSRMNIINTVLNGIKLVKLYGWEDAFNEKITKYRKLELKNIFKIRLFNGIINFFMNLTPVLISLATFITYIYLNGTLSASTAFVSLSVFFIIRFPVLFLPEVLSTLIVAKVSYKRISNFLSLPEIEESDINYNASCSSGSKPYVKISDGSFAFSKDQKPILMNINLNIKQGELHAFVGSNGSGKTSLMESLINNMERIDGSININGKIAYVPQQPWIRNCSVRDNIIGNYNFEYSKYQEIINVCELEQDISTLPAYDQTEVGEKGVNLSGGQKQRISLARALYSDSDIYLFDDPLCAVDKEIGVKIFENVISFKGYLKDRIRLFITHNDDFLRKTDLIHILKDGKIDYEGTYDYLLKNKPDFKNYLKKDTQEDSANISVPNEGIRVTPDLVKKPSQEPNVRSYTESKLITEETIHRGRIKLKVYKEYINSLNCGIFSLFIIFIILAPVSNIAIQLLIAQYTSDNITRSTAPRFLSYFSGLSVSFALATMLYILTLALGTYISSNKLHQRMLASLLKSPVRYFEQTPIGRIINVFSKDMSVIDENISRSLQFFMNLFFTLLFSLVGISIKNPFIIIFIFVLAIFYYFIQMAFIKTSRQAQRLESVLRSPVSSYFIDTHNGLSIIRSSNQQIQSISEFNSLVQSNITPYSFIIFCNRWLGFRLELIASLLIFFSSMCLVLMVLISPVKSGYVGFILNATTSITQTMSFFVRTRCDFENHLVSLERIVEYYTSPHEYDPPPAIELEEEWPTKGEIVFNSYSCSYRPGLPNTLKNVSFKINPREKVGVVGRTGAGKSSLLLSLFRMIETTSGSIHIDGVDISKISLKDLRQNLAIIPQDPFLFEGSFRDNIDPFRQYTDSEIWKVLTLSQLNDFQKSHEQGLYYKIQEFGSNLSSGEKQLICLARALLKKSKILILDEATANVDLETDRTIQEVIRSHSSSCTVITVAHRLETVLNYDRIMVMDSGSIIEFDSPSVLLNDKNSALYKMVSSKVDL